MKVFIILLFVISYSSAFSQNYFPLNKGDKNIVRVQQEVHCNGGIDYFTDDYFNGTVDNDTIIDGKIFYRWHFGKTQKFLYYDRNNQILYIRRVLNTKDTTVKAFNFGLKVGESDTSWFNLNYYGDELQLISKSLNYVEGTRKFYLKYSGHFANNYEFIEDVGLLKNEYGDYFATCEASVKETLVSSITDSLIYKRLDLLIGSTNLMNDTPINFFPFNFKVYFLDKSVLLDTFQLELNIIRNDSVFSSSVYDIDKDSFTVFIPLDSTVLQINDTIAYRVFVSDTTIFHNSNYYPYIGYKKIKVLSAITGVSDNSVLNKFHLLQNYPNPFNPTTKIKYAIPASLNPSKGGTLIQLKIYDVLGNEIATLVNKEQSPGEYEVEFDVGKYNLSSGVYFYQLNAGGFISTKKMILLR